MDLGRAELAPGCAQADGFQALRAGPGRGHGLDLLLLQQHAQQFDAQDEDRRGDDDEVGGSPQHQLKSPISDMVDSRFPERLCRQQRNDGNEPWVFLGTESPVPAKRIP